MRTAVIFAALISMVVASNHDVMQNYTKCSKSNFCQPGNECVITKFSPATGNAANDTTGYEDNWTTRCMPCTYSEKDNSTRYSSAIDTVNDPQWTQPGSGYSGSYNSWSSGSKFFAIYLCPFPRVNMTDFPNPNKNRKATGISCSSTDFKKLAIQAFESFTLSFQILYETFIVVIPRSDVRSMFVSFKKGLNSSPGAIGFLISALYYIGVDQGVGDILCEIAGYAFVVTNALSQVANFAG